MPEIADPFTMVDMHRHEPETVLTAPDGSTKYLASSLDRIVERGTTAVAPPFNNTPHQGATP